MVRVPRRRTGGKQKTVMTRKTSPVCGGKIERAVWKKERGEGAKQEEEGEESVVKSPRGQVGKHLSS